MKKFFTIICCLLITSAFFGCNSQKVENEKDKPSSELTSKQESSTSKEKDKLENNKEKENSKEVAISEKKDAVLKLGSENEKVKILQHKLNKFGYKLNEDGNFGKSTDFAVKNFQSKLKITIDGIVGEETFKLLDSTPAKAPYIYVPSDEKSKDEVAVTKDKGIEDFINSKDCPSSTNYFIYTNLSNHRVYIFTGQNHKWKLQKSTVCTVGKKSTPTIRGHFSVGTKGTEFVTEGGVIAKYFTQIRGNYLFHSILYDKKGNVVDGRLGMDLSHGCIRLSLSDAKHIYDNVPHLSGIWIE